MKSALITGVAGQDGYYLASLLLSQGYRVHGVVLPGTGPLTGVYDKVLLHEADLSEEAHLTGLLREAAPDEVYYLAAHHFSSQGDENRKGMAGPFLSVNLLAPNTILEAIKCSHPRTRFFYAASSHVFGTPDSSPQNEFTPHKPGTPYAISKSAAVMLCRYYRETHGLHASAGILYNHESPLRPLDFVTARLARAAACAATGKGSPAYFKDLSAVVDWGAAKDYVRAMWLILQQEKGGEYIIASGVPRTIRDFAETAFSSVGLKSEKFIYQDNSAAKSSVAPYVGDSSRVHAVCGWTLAISFEEMVAEMVKHHVSLLKRGECGESVSLGTTKYAGN